jgi:hypothetical protein
MTLRVYDTQHSKHPIHESALGALDIIARVRTGGVVSSDVSSRLGIAPRNFHYVLKV